MPNSRRNGSRTVDKFEIVRLIRNKIGDVGAVCVYVGTIAGGRPGVGAAVGVSLGVPVWPTARPTTSRPVFDGSSPVPCTTSPRTEQKRPRRSQAAPATTNSGFTSPRVCRARVILAAERRVSRNRLASAGRCGRSLAHSSTKARATGGRGGRPEAGRPLFPRCDNLSVSASSPPLDLAIMGMLILEPFAARIALSGNPT